MQITPFNIEIKQSVYLQLYAMSLIKTLEYE